MRARTPCRLLLAMLVGATAGGAEPDLGIPPEFRTEFESLDVPVADSPSIDGALPAPSLTDPFDIGEALADPARVDQGVVSLLDRMGMGLPESLVRGLVETTREDLLLFRATGRESRTFRDLHAAVRPLLPELDAAELAAAYARAYDGAPDALVPQVLQHLPIEPDTPLTRIQWWLLLVDGFAPPPAAAKLAQAGPLRLAQAGTGRWGAASLVLPRLPSPDPRIDLEDWHYLISILPVIAWGIPFDVVPMFPDAHEGHGGPGEPVGLEARIGLNPSAFVSPYSGQPLLQPRLHDRGDRTITWRVPELPRLLQHGRLDSAPGTPQRTDMLGVARLTFLPKPEDGNDRRAEVQETVALEAGIDSWELVSTHYDLSPLLRGFLQGSRTAHGYLGIGWHTDDWLRVSLRNDYHAVLDMGPLGGGRRIGKDIAEGTLAWNEERGTWEGIMDASADAWNQMHSPLGFNCPRKRSAGRQQLRVTGRETPGFNPHTQTIVNMTGGARIGGHLALEFSAASRPRMALSDACQILIWRDPEPIPFIPLNDARWTIPNGSYPIAYPESDVLSYSDYVVAATMRSSWKVTVERPPPAP